VEQSPSWEVNIYSASQEILIFYVIPRFITVFIRARHWSLNLVQMNPVHNLIPYFSSIHFSIALHLWVGLPSCLFPSVFPNKIWHTSSLPYIQHVLHISFTLIWSPSSLEKGINNKARQEVFPNLVLCPSSYIHIYSSAPCS